MFGGIQNQMMSAVANPAESDHFRALAGAFVAIEREQREELRDLCEALDGDPAEFGIEDVPDEEERVDELLGAVSARMNGDPWALWVENQAPERLKQPEKAKQYAGLDADEWQGEIEDWADRLRANDAVDTDGRTDRELAGAHVTSVFGLSLEEFERHVVGWSPGQVFETAFARTFLDNTSAISAMADATAEGNQ